jgi:hypothetical protein
MLLEVLSIQNFGREPLGKYLPGILRRQEDGVNTLLQT